MSSHTCIYCKQHRPVAEFTTEHVLPKSFGHFRHGLTLAPRERPAVCRTCNQHFGDTLDRHLARDSYEAFLRIKKGVADSGDLHKFFGSRVTMALPPESRWGPLKVALTFHQGHTRLDLVPQVRFRTSGGGYVCFSEAELASTDLRQIVGLDLESVSIFSSDSSPQAEGRLKTLLEQQDVRMKVWNAIPDLPSHRSMPEEIELLIFARVDAIVARAIAKIGLNYLAYNTTAEFALREAFDPVREFILKGDGEWRRFVRYSDQPILFNDTEELRHTDGHLIVLEWERPRQEALRCRVSLFNDFTYVIRLCEEFRGVWRNLVRGHYFSLEPRTVQPLGHSRLIRMIPPVVLF